MTDTIFNITTVDSCEIIDLGKIITGSGHITVVAAGTNLSFDIKRVYYTYDIPGGVSRGGHAHKGLYQLLLAVSGGFDVVLKDGVSTRRVSLNRPYQGLFVKPGIWREIENFTSGSVLLVFASEEYSEDDYLRDYNEFLKCKGIK